MSITTKFPTTYEELAEMGSGQISFPATWEEYLDLLETAEFRVEFDENEITTMGYASLNHEELVLRLGHLLANLFDEYPNYRLFGSGRPVYIGGKKVYMPDIQVANDTPKLVEYSKGLDAHINPWLIVEVLSQSTKSRDWNTKLTNYKKIPSVEYILYVQQDTAYISLFKRSAAGNFWENYDFDELDQSIEIDGKSILMGDIYRKILA